MLLKNFLGSCLGRRTLDLPLNAGVDTDTSYGRHLQVRAYYWKKFMQYCPYIHSSGRSLLPGHFLRTTWNFGRLRSCSLAWQQGKLCDTICVTKFKTAIIDGLLIYFCRAWHLHPMDRHTAKEVSKIQFWIWRTIWISDKRLLRISEL